jgi:hypothetical protein
MLLFSSPYFKETKGDHVESGGGLVNFGASRDRAVGGRHGWGRRRVNVHLCSGINHTFFGLMVFCGFLVC